MKSIRRTLLFGVLAVLVVTLGVVSLVVYRLAVDTLREKQHAARDLIEVRHNEVQDGELRNRAENLARDVQQNFVSEKFWLLWRAAEAGVVFSAAMPSHVSLVVPAYTATASPGTLGIYTRAATELTLNLDDTYHNSDFEFVEVAADWSPGAVWKSKSMSGHSLPMDLATLHPEADPTPRFDNVASPDGATLRRVTLRAPVSRYGRVVPWFGRSPRNEAIHPSRAVTGLGSAARSDAGRRAGPPTIVGSTLAGTDGYALPNFYLQCAWDTSANNPALRDKIAERDWQLAEIDSDTERSVRNLRATLVWTFAGAVAATLMLCWIIVGLGLFPLKRLSFAVSQITPKDLHLELDPRTLPSEIHPVAERFKQSLTQLQAAFEREKRAAADISHELRTPLAALTTTIEVACRKSRTAEQYRQTLDECRGIAKQMSLLVERMLTLAWLDAGADEVRPEKVEVSELVRGVAAIGKPLAEAQGLSFRVSTPGPLTIQTDPDKVREVVMNLIHNAIEYNRPGGEVEVTATPTVQGVMLEVRDTGIGMSSEVQGKIFERFFRGDPSRQATGVHAGLGLAIVKEYVDRLGGQLSVESAVGRGSRFRVELPNAL
jgi:two-component system, OmpR family, heavy metal sensor histidine kinase CusS